MKLDRDKLQDDIHKLYREEHEVLGKAGTNRLLERGVYWGYNQHYVEAKSDGRDAGQVIRFVRGPLTGEILGIAISDATGLYNAEPPTWVAGALIEWKKNLPIN